MQFIGNVGSLDLQGRGYNYYFNIDQYQVVLFMDGMIIHKVV